MHAVGLAKRTPTLVCNSVYGAAEGDTCGSVAQMFNLSLKSFLSINPNINCRSFFVGQWLCIDGATK
ncbi:putative LysM domain-containing protein [Rosa chinensis]|uniref:Putative LysM domain-containing protein n=1 Tax=Rosa chinensis TaxID=74649 RepID=A0A2P6S2V7_ROSCH|nr:putative LysM domain-containing protein [Rosa chinensis]PRQ53005.1 putative LysM domain-containing protein [Rosa chinensis]